MHAERARSLFLEPLHTGQGGRRPRAQVLLEGVAAALQCRALEHEAVAGNAWPGVVCWPIYHKLEGCFHCNAGTYTNDRFVDLK